MHMEKCFKTVTLSRSREQAALDDLISMVKRSEIRIVDIKRHRDRLVIVYRHLAQSKPAN